MGIIRDFNDGRMEALRSISYSETGTETPYVTNEPSVLNSITQFFPDEASRRINDTARIAKMLVDKPGLKFTGNQALLGQVELERKARAAAQAKRNAGGTGAGAVLAGFAAAAGQVLKIVGSTLAQVPVNGTGTHFVRAFKTDTYLQPAEDPDNPGPGAFAQFFGAGGIEGAPIALEGGTIIPDNEGQAEYNPLHPSLIKDRFDNNDITTKFKPQTEPNELGDVSVGTKTTEEENNVFTDTERTTQLIDYRKLENKGYRSNTYSFNYGGPESGNVVKEVRVGLGNQGKKRKRTNYLDIDIDTIDRVNNLGVLKNAPDSLKGEILQDTSDFVKLVFDIITPEDSYFLQFRAFLDQFSDSFSGDWSATKYIGRAEDFYTYNGFTRQISLGFKIAAATRAEMNPLYEKITALASVVTPTYGGSESKFMRGTIARVTVGEYLYNVPGIIESVDFNWQTDYPWEIRLEKNDGVFEQVNIVPHVLDCSLNFKPIHDFVPQAGLPEYKSERLIMNAETVRTNNQAAASGLQASSDLQISAQGIPAGGI